MDIINQETKHLQELKQRIEERKKAFAVQKKSDVITLQEPSEQPSEDTVRTLTVVESKINTEENEPPKHQQSKNIGKEKHTHEFKVLGAKDFEKKTKVSIYVTKRIFEKMIHIYNSECLVTWYSSFIIILGFYFCL